MSVPYNIDFPRFLGASFRQKWEGEFDPGLLVERLGEPLGFSAEESRSFLEAFAQKATISLAEPLTTRQGMLRLYPNFKQVSGQFEEWVSETFADSDFRGRFEAMCESHIIFEKEDNWPALLRFVQAFWFARKVDSYGQMILREVQVFTLNLIVRDEDKYVRAAKEWHPFGGDTEDDTKSFLQNAGLVGHRLLGAADVGGDRTAEPDNGDMAEAGGGKAADLHEKMPDIIDAWCLAYEDQLFHICCFLWFAKRDLTEPADLAFAPKQRGEIAKGAVYNEVKDWCFRNDLKFPFHKDGVEIRNAVAHRRCLLDSEQQKFIFLDSEKRPRSDIGHIAYKDLHDDMLHDIAVIQYFLAGRALGEQTAMNLQGRFDAAWSKFRAKAVDYTWVFDRALNSSCALGERAATHDEVMAYLKALSPIELAALIGELRDTWAEP